MLTSDQFLRPISGLKKCSQIVSREIGIHDLKLYLTENSNYLISVLERSVHL